MQDQLPNDCRLAGFMDVVHNRGAVVNRRIAAVCQCQVHVNFHGVGPYTGESDANGRDHEELC